MTNLFRCQYCGALYPMAGPESLLFHVLNEHPRSEMAANIQIESVFDPSVTA